MANSTDFKPTVVHTIMVDGKIYKQLLDVKWYDTATPYLGCVRDLQQLYDLAASTSFEIVSYGKNYQITSQRDLLHWVGEVFERGIEFGFRKRLKVE